MNVDLEDEISGRPAAVGRRALAGDANAAPFIGARRNADRDGHADATVRTKLDRGAAHGRREVDRLAV